MNRKLPTIVFFLSQILILIVGTLGAIGIYFYLNPGSFEKAENYLNPVTSTPTSFTLELDQPADDALSFQSSIVVSGKTFSNSPVLISSDRNDVVVQTDVNGRFSTVFRLSEGLNTLLITIFDPKGDKKEVTKTIYYSKEKL